MLIQSECDFDSQNPFLDNLQTLSLWSLDRPVIPRTHRANIGTASRPFVLPRPDEELDARLFNVDSHFDCRMQIENGKHVIVDSVMLASNAIHGLDLHGFALSTETRWQSATLL